MSKKFKHLNLSPHWQQYFSKYPDGYTIIENLIDWVSQVDDMVDNQNAMNDTVNTFGDRLDEFIGKFDTHLQETVEQTLSDWQNSGFLNMIINETLDTKYHEMDKRLTTQLSHKATKGYIKQSDLDKNSFGFDPSWFDDDFLVDLSNNEINTTYLEPQSVKTKHLADKSVTPQTTDFLKRSRNIFDKSASKSLGGHYSSSNGSWVDNSTFYTIMVETEPDMVYKNNLPNKLHLAFFDSNMDFVSGVEAGTWTDIVTPNDPNVRYVSVPFLSSFTDLSGIMIVANEFPNEYIPYSFSFTDKINLFGEGAKTEIVSVNRFNKEGVISGKEVYADGDIRNNANSAISGFVNIPENTINIYISGLTPYAEGLPRYISFYDKDKNPIGSSKQIEKELSEYSLAVPDNTKFINFSIYQRKTSDENVNLHTIQVEVGGSKTEYTPYREGIVEIDGYKVGSDKTHSEEVKTEDKVGLFFGDSITETARVSDDGSSYEEGTRSNWPTYAKNLLRLKTMKNYAKSGASYKDRKLEPRQYIGYQIQQALDNNEKADFIVVSGGTNDGGTNLGDFETALSKPTLEDLDTSLLYESLRHAFWTLRDNYPDAQIFTATPIQRADREPIKELREAIVKMAKRYNILVIDAEYESGIVKDFEVWGEDGRYLSDGLHTNENGKVKMAQLYSRVISNTYNF